MRETKKSPGFGIWLSCPTNSHARVNSLSSSSQWNSGATKISRLIWPCSMSIIWSIGRVVVICLSFLRAAQAACTGHRSCCARWGPRQGLAFAVHAEMLGTGATQAKTAVDFAAPGISHLTQSQLVGIRRYRPRRHRKSRIVDQPSPQDFPIFTAGERRGADRARGVAGRGRHSAHRSVPADQQQRHGATGCGLRSVGGPSGTGRGGGWRHAAAGEPRRASARRRSADAWHDLQGARRCRRRLRRGRDERACRTGVGDARRMRDARTGRTGAPLWCMRSWRQRFESRAGGGRLGARR